MADKRVPLGAVSAYVPKYRVSRAQVAELVGQKGRGNRVAANFDEDSTTMAVEAAAPVVASGASFKSLWFATTTPAYADKTNGTSVHAALGLPSRTASFDLGASFRSGYAAVLAASQDEGLAVMSDVREGKAGGADERDGADVAAALSFVDVPDPVAWLLATSSRSGEFLDRWRAPGSSTGTSWEERFAQTLYAELGEEAVAEVLERAGISIDDVAGVVVTSPNIRAARTFSASLQKRAGVARGSSDLLDLIGNSGAAQLGVELVDQLERASAGEFILAVSLADGADAMVFEVGAAVCPVGTSVRDQVSGPAIDVDYAKYLLWRGRFAGESPRRPDPMRPSAPYAARNAEFKFGLHGGRCGKCGTVQYPLPRVCLSCKAVDDFDVVGTAGRTATIVTYTVDRLAFTASPPLVAAVVDMEGGGRMQCELTDVDPETLSVGDPVQMTFRRLGTVEGIHNYFWKARPAEAAASAEVH
jgi:hydroxymethylglutaryl-CoA synthase